LHYNLISIFPTYLPLHTLYNTPPIEREEEGKKGGALLALG